MRYIKKLTEHIEEEIESAKEYAESYVEFKAKGNTTVASRFKSMAEDELTHAGFFHEQAVMEIEKLGKIYTPPVDMMEKWEHEHKEYVERTAWIRQMLAM
jgi:ferritin